METKPNNTVLSILSSLFHAKDGFLERENIVKGSSFNRNDTLILLLALKDLGLVDCSFDQHTTDVFYFLTKEGRDLMTER